MVFGCVLHLAQGAPRKRNIFLPPLGGFYYYNYIIFYFILFIGDDRARTCTSVNGRALFWRLSRPFVVHLCDFFDKSAVSSV